MAEFVVSQTYRFIPLQEGLAGNGLILEMDSGTRCVVSPQAATIVDAIANGDSLLDTAALLSTRLGTEVTEDAVRTFISTRLLPLGVVQETGSTVLPLESEKQRSSGLERLMLRFIICPARVIRPVADALSQLVPSPRWFALIFCALFVVVGVWLFVSIPSGNYALQILRVFPYAALAAVGAVFVHELGHAAAARRFGVEHGSLGFGVYLVFPLLYMELDEVWRLPRQQRMVVDAAGIFFQMLCAVVLCVIALFWPGLTPFLAAAVLMIMSSALVMLNPFFRFDGYWILSDMLGVTGLRRISIASARHYALSLIHRKPALSPLDAHYPSWVRRTLPVYGAAASSFLTIWLGLFLWGGVRYGGGLARILNMRWQDLSNAINHGSGGRAILAFLILALHLLVLAALLVFAFRLAKRTVTSIAFGIHQLTLIAARVKTHAHSR